jgi:CRISPR system Cascade subunit CasE
VEAEAQATQNHLRNSLSNSPPRPFRQGRDLYCELATTVFNRPVSKKDTHERAVGKLAILGCQYSMGADRFASTCKHNGVDLAAAGVTAEQVIETYRDAYPKIAGYPRADGFGRTGGIWKAFEAAALATVQSGQPHQTKHCLFAREGDALVVTLPSGRRSCFRNARIEKRVPGYGGNAKPTLVLFRVDPDRTGARTVILVQSDFRPQWQRLEERGTHYLLVPPELKEFQPSFTRGQRLRFRLRANPTKKVFSLSKAERLAGTGGVEGKTKNGRRLALLREEEQIAWLLQKGKHGGFRIPGEWLPREDGRKVPNFRVDLIPEGWVRCGKDGYSDGRFFAVRFEGVLEVTDPEQLRQSVADGIGSAKGFGFGLLSLARAEG